MNGDDITRVIRILFQEGLDPLVQCDGIARSDGGISPTVVPDQFSAVGAEAPEVRVARIQDRPGLFVNLFRSRSKSMVRQSCAQLLMTQRIVLHYTCFLIGLPCGTL